MRKKNLTLVGAAIIRKICWMGIIVDTWTVWLGVGRFFLHRAFPLGSTVHYFEEVFLTWTVADRREPVTWCWRGSWMSPSNAPSKVRDSCLSERIEANTHFPRAGFVVLLITLKWGFWSGCDSPGTLQTLRHETVQHSGASTVLLGSVYHLCGY
jgi:hypothetical protein